MKKIFEKARLGNLEIPNRLVRSSTFEKGCVVDGVITDSLKEVLVELAKGGVGTIITGMMSVMRNSEIDKSMSKIYDESFKKNFSEIADEVHRAGSKIIVQLGHCGAKTKIVDSGSHISAPSDTQLERELPAKAMTKDEIAAAITAHGKAALQCKEAGADGVQLHCAHGYLISEFLSPYFNKRTDEYGGAIENRARIALETYDEIRAQTGSSYPVLVKINYDDLVEPTIAPNEINWVCAELSRRGIDAIEVSAGIGINSKSSPSRRGFTEEGFFVSYAADIASKISAPVIVMGGLRTPAKIEELLNQYNFGVAAISRPFIREPALANRWKGGDKTKATCVSCSKCFLMNHHGCFVDAGGIK
jgi:2,4-dienoyl-CoA reductase-like NADH-dependent reductase (Old Yellow Enzyme family)